MESSSGRFCDNCEHRHISIAAVTWCPDCDEAFCSECIDHHDALKIAKLHKTISLTEFDKLPSFIKETSVYCTEHDQRCEFYCCIHRQCCCCLCLKESHFHCEKSDMIQDVVKNVKTSPVLEDIENGLKCLMTSLDSLIQNRLENKTRLNAQKFAFMEEIKNIRKLVNDNLDEMERKLKDTLASEVEDFSSDLDNILQELDVHKRHISTLQGELKTVISIATNLQVFLGLIPLELKVDEEQSYLESLTTNKTMDEFDLVLDIAPNIRAISEISKSFGEISQSRKRNDLQLSVRKKEQAQLLLPSVNELSNIQFSEKASFQIPKGKNSIYISGCTILPEGLCVFADEVNSRLIIYNSGGIFIRAIHLSFSPRDVAYIHSSNIGVTCKSSKKVVLVELISGKQMSSFSTEEMCYGLSFLNEMLTIRITGTFLMMTLGGEIKNRLKGDGLTHCCAGEGCVFTSDCSNHTVLCYKLNGDLSWQFQNPKLRTPRDVTMDENGYVLVTGETSNNLFAISPNGQVWREILDDLDGPYAIEYDKASKLMVITNETGSAKIYQKK